MFKRKSSNSSSGSDVQEKVIKLVNQPTHEDWLGVHHDFGLEHLGYLVMMTSGKIKFIAKKTNIEIHACELVVLFEDIGKEWSRKATPEELNYMKDRSAVLASFLLVPEESSEEEISHAPVSSSCPF